VSSGRYTSFAAGRRFGRGSIELSSIRRRIDSGGGAGVTARFNLNVLGRINRELGGDFNLSAFTHRAIYNRDRHRIEMHLISSKTQTVRVLGRSFSFRPGETIHTESSYKYSLERFTALARGSGWTLRHSWTDAASMFSVHALAASD